MNRLQLSIAFWKMKGHHREQDSVDENGPLMSETRYVELQ